MTVPLQLRPDGMPRGFIMKSDGIYVSRDGKDGEPPEWKRLCSPIEVLALPCGADGRGWGRLVEIIDPDGRTHRWAIPAEMLAGDGIEVRREAFHLGLDLEPSTRARNEFLSLLQLWRPSARALTVDCLGWASPACHAFTLGNGDVIGADNVVYQSESAPSAAREIKPAGSLAEWRDTVGAACVGNPVLIACVSLAFAGPLLEPLQVEGGGLHLRGASSRGKSSAQRVAVSVWGSPKFLHTWRATANGLEGTASACNSTLLALDEMGEVAAREAGAAAYMLANGQGKMRASRTGSARPSARWRLPILSSGEISLADKMSEGRERIRAGQEVRLLDIPADNRTHGAFDTLHGKPDGKAFAEHINRAAAAAYGTAGPAFVEALLSDLEGTTASVSASVETFCEEAAKRVASEDGQVKRGAQRLGLIAAAGELATKFGITGWGPGEAFTAAMEVFDLWIASRGGAGSAEARDALTRTREFIVAHGLSRFETHGGEKVMNRAGWRVGDLYCFAPDVWRREVHAGADGNRAALLISAAGLLERGDGKNLAKRITVPGEQRVRAYCVSATIMDMDDE
ncbi:MAG: DUF927 domain-containing protein [Pseudomonadota bacterium]